MTNCQAAIIEAFALLPSAWSLSALAADDGAAYAALEGQDDDESFLLMPASDGSHVAALSVLGEVVAKASTFAELRAAILPA